MSAVVLGNFGLGNTFSVDGMTNGVVTSTLVVLVSVAGFKEHFGSAFDGLWQKTCEG